jgi:hypothetical protein
MGYYDIDPRDIDPETNLPYANYSSPSLDTSFHDHEMDADEPELWVVHYREGYGAVAAKGFIGPFNTKEEANTKAGYMADRYPYWQALGEPAPLGSDPHCEHCDGEGIEPCGISFDAGDGEGEDRPCSVCAA